MSGQENLVPLSVVAAVIRSKNAGPFELTLDVIFKRAEDYFYLKRKEFFTVDLVSSLYQVEPQDVLRIVYFDPAYALKITLVRPLPSGSVGDTDIYGAQQHAPLLGLLVPVPG